MKVYVVCERGSCVFSLLSSARGGEENHQTRYQTNHGRRWNLRSKSLTNHRKSYKIIDHGNSRNIIGHIWTHMETRKRCMDIVWEIRRSKLFEAIAKQRRQGQGGRQRRRRRRWLRLRRLRPKSGRSIPGLENDPQCPRQLLCGLSSIQLNRCCSLHCFVHAFHDGTRSTPELAHLRQLQRRLHAKASETTAGASDQPQRRHQVTALPR